MNISLSEYKTILRSLIISFNSLEYIHNFVFCCCSCLIIYHSCPRSNKNKTSLSSSSLSLLQFSKETLANMYSAYIDNFLNAKDAVRIAKEAKPAFHKFLEVSVSRIHRMSCFHRATAVCLCLDSEKPVQLLEPVTCCNERGR